MLSLEPQTLPTPTQSRFYLAAESALLALSLASLLGTAVVILRCEWVVDRPLDRC